MGKCELYKIVSEILQHEQGGSEMALTFNMAHLIQYSPKLVAVDLICIGWTADESSLLRCATCGHQYVRMVDRICCRV